MSVVERAHVLRHANLLEGDRAPGLVTLGGHLVLLWSRGPPRWRADPPPPARPPGRATIGGRVGPARRRRPLGLQPVAVPAEMPVAKLPAGPPQPGALADPDPLRLSP